MKKINRGRGGQDPVKKYEVRYLPAPERIHSGTSSVVLQRDLPKAAAVPVSRPRRVPTGKPKRGAGHTRTRRKR